MVHYTQAESHLGSAPCHESSYWSSWSKDKYITFNKTTFIIYGAIMGWFFSQSLQYRPKALLTDFLYCLTFPLTHLWNEVTCDWNVNSQKTFVMKLWCSSEHPSKSKSCTWAPFEQFSYRPNSLLQVPEQQKESTSALASSTANSRVNVRCNIIQCNTGDGLCISKT